MKRLKDAFRTNEPQATVVVFLMFLSPLAAEMRKPHAPTETIVALALVWPALAFFSNLIDPIPADEDEGSHE